jgi:hypothetical protein
VNSETSDDGTNQIGSFVWVDERAEVVAGCEFDVGAVGQPFGDPFGDTCRAAFDVDLAGHHDDACLNFGELLEKVMRRSHLKGARFVFWCAAQRDAESIGSNPYSTYARRISGSKNIMGGFEA